jgi:uncharacterized protein (DUF1778 family)
MTTSKKPRALKSEIIPVRFSPQHLDLVDRAAALLGETRADFLRNSSHQRALETLRSADSLGLGVASAPGEVA